MTCRAFHYARVILIQSPYVLCNSPRDRALLPPVRCVHLDDLFEFVQAHAHHLSQASSLSIITKRMANRSPCWVFSSIVTCSSAPRCTKPRSPSSTRSSSRCSSP